MRYMKKRCVRAKKQEATKTTKDGRTITLNNAAGRAEKLKLKAELWKRQKGICSLCGLPLYGIKESDYEHEVPGLGNRDDKNWNEDGTPKNSLAHRFCNLKKGSKRIPVNHFPAGDTEDEWPSDGGDF